MRKGKWFLYGFGWLVAGAAMLTLMGFATMYLWNWLIPEIFGGVTVTFFQAIGLIALGKLLTGFMGFGSWKGRHWRHHHQDRAYWQKKWESRMENMNPEDREKFKKYYYDRCGWKMNKDEGGKKEEAKQNGYTGA